MVQIFVSYAHDDTALLEGFLRALTPVARRRRWEIWYDARITAGRHLDGTIRKAIAASDVFLCFVSQSFLVSTYILEEELPAIRDAVATRDALQIPVVVDDCHWKTECDGPRAVPLDPRGKLRPIRNWGRHAKGFHAASQQVIEGIDGHLTPPSNHPSSPPPIPPDEPGPRFGPAGDRFDIVGITPPEDELTAPTQVRLYERLNARVGRLEKSLEFYAESLPDLQVEFTDYRRFVRVPLQEIDVASLFSAGNGLAAMIEAFRIHDPRVTNTPALEPQILAGLTALVDDHFLFVGGFEEGKELLARAAENRLHGDDQKDVRDRTETVLGELDRPDDLLGPRAKTLVVTSLRALRDGEWSHRDLVETAAALAVNGVVGIGREVARHLTTGERGRFEGITEAHEPIMVNEAAIRSAIRFFSTSAEALTALAAGQEIHRFVGWLGEASRRVVRGTGTGEPSIGPIPPPAQTTPPDFDIDRVKEMILRGEEVPETWIEWITELSIPFAPEFRDLTPVARLRRLETLTISGTGVADLGPIAGLANLRYLKCISTEVTDLAPIAGLTNLSVLAISDTRVRDLEPIAGLDKLHYLECEATEITDLGPIARLTALEELHVAGTDVRDLAPISGLEKLRHLDCSSTGIIDILPLIRLTTLATLRIVRTGVRDLRPLTGLIDLKYLDCTSTKITDLQPLTGLANLQYLDCDSTEVFDLGPIAGLANLRHLDCSLTKVADLSPLTHLTALEDLHVAGTGVRDLRPIAGLASLHIFDARDLGNVLPPETWPAELEQLNLRGTRRPANRPLPAVPWRIDPNGTIQRGKGETPYPFRQWAADELTPRRRRRLTGVPPPRI
jgi:Leucine-rich repeat (LRR) protein